MEISSVKSIVEFVQIILHILIVYMVMDAFILLFGITNGYINSWENIADFFFITCDMNLVFLYSIF